RKSAPQIFLIDDGAVAHQPKNLTVTKCFACAQRILKYKYTAYCIFIQLRVARVNAFINFFGGYCPNGSGGAGPRGSGVAFVALSRHTLDFTCAECYLS